MKLASNGRFLTWLSLPTIIRDSSIRVEEIHREPIILRTPFHVVSASRTLWLLMPSTPWLKISEADDPFAPIFLTVAELTERIKRSLENDFAEVALHGEVSNVTRPRSGHFYFTLKDDSASIRAVMWKNDAQRITFDLSDGLSVRALGRVTVYPPRGEYQIVVRHLEPEGIGALELAFRQRYARLLQEGLFDPARKRPLAPLPPRDRDRLEPDRRGRARRAAGHRPPLAMRQSADRPDPRSRSRRRPGSGGRAGAGQSGRRRRPDHRRSRRRQHGRPLDLQRGNRRSRNRRSGLPVVSAVGHEIDVTLADLAADRRALTPSEAGEVSVPDAREVLEHLDRLAERLRSAGTTQLKDAQLRLDDLAQRAGWPSNKRSSTAGTAFRGWPPASRR